MENHDKIISNRIENPTVPTWNTSSTRVAPNLFNGGYDIVARNYVPKYNMLGVKPRSFRRTKENYIRRHRLREIERDVSKIFESAIVISNFVV